MAVPIPLIAVGAAVAGWFGWRYFGAPKGVSIQYPLTSKIAFPLSEAQRNAALSAEKAMLDNNIPPEIGAAMLANAWGESKLRVQAVGDHGQSAGIWQIRDRGGVAPYLANLSERSDPYKSTVAMIRFMNDHKGTPTIPGAGPPVPIADPWTAYDNGVRNIETLTTAFRVHVERPTWTQAKQDKRERIASQMFPIRAVI